MGAGSAEKLSADAAAAQSKIGVHGVSVLNASRPNPIRPMPNGATLEEIAKNFIVHKTGSTGHYAVKLPNPVTEEVAALFNRSFGR